MNVIRNICTTIDVYDAISLYADLQNNLMTILRWQFERRCKDQMLILEVLRILRIGDCCVSTDGAPDKCTLSIEFEVNAIEVHPRTILTNCAVVRRDGISLTCNHQYAAIVIRDATAIPYANVGNIIPIRALKATYPIGGDKIMIYGAPVIEKYQPIIFRSLMRQADIPRRATAIITAINDTLKNPQLAAAMNTIDKISNVAAEDSVGESIVAVDSGKLTLKLPARLEGKHISAMFVPGKTPKIVITEDTAGEVMPFGNMLCALLLSYHNLLAAALDIHENYTADKMVKKTAS